ncbi:RTA1 like protein [Penicillium canescens]|uniref:RTA1 like protein n=2 Tax=Penicillium canescens TaxID=5083 RepID=A0AAD6N366_PENCN|nr:RTA1 like protein [Penicillium canescens]KAJ6039889.1 RTA1 like protein [Penicillium canescens]
MQEIVPRSYTFWYYTPSLPAAVIFMLIFMGLTGLHSWKLFTTKTWFCIAFTLGGLFEIIGYIGRAIAHSNTTTMGPYILENIFILLAPTLFAASIYMTLGRVIRRVGAEHLSVIRVSRLTKTFVWGDVLSFVVQGNSSSLSILGYPQWAKVAVIGGLAIQLVSFSIFWISAFVFERRIRRYPTPESLLPGIPWKKALYMLYAVSALIMIRSIFRIIEYVLGNNGYPLQHEWTLYVFDSVPMAIVMIIYLTWYPSDIKSRADIEGSMPLAYVYSEV